MACSMHLDLLSPGTRVLKKTNLFFVLLLGDIGNEQVNK